jgi:hypothetical protein
MNLKKNLAAKLGAAVASVAALLGTWALVHTNPPPPAAADTPAAAPAAASATPARGKRAPAAAPAAVTRKRHTRTHVS